jgi:hypothetical protein
LVVDPEAYAAMGIWSSSTANALLVRGKVRPVDGGSRNCPITS